MKELCDKVALARGPGMQSFEELCINELLGTDPETLRLYLQRKPLSAFSVAITRARVKRVSFVKAKMSEIISNDKHNYQGRMITWYLERFGGDEFKQDDNLTVKGTVSLKGMPSVHDIMKAMRRAKKGG